MRHILIILSLFYSLSASGQVDMIAREKAQAALDSIAVMNARFNSLVMSGDTFVLLSTPQGIIKAKLVEIIVQSPPNPNPTIPTVATTTANTITSTSAIAGGNVTSIGSSAVTARGVVWNTSATPTISNSKTTDESGTGSFQSTLTSLNANTLYYYRAYATNTTGTGYGTEYSFTTLAPPAGCPNTIDFSSVTTGTQFTNTGCYTVIDGAGNYGNSIQKYVDIHVSSANNLLIHFDSFSLADSDQLTIRYYNTDPATPDYTLTGSTIHSDITAQKWIRITFTTNGSGVSSGFSFTVTPQ